MDTANEALSQLNRYYSKDPTNRAPEIHDAYRILRQCIAQIPELEPSQVPETSQNLDDLCSFAYKSMQAQSEDALFHVNIRQAYTDGCIAWVLLRSIVATNQVDEDLWIQCIQKLDGALVFSSGPNRLDLVHALIQHIQQTRLPIEYTTSFKPLIPPEDIAQVSLPPCGRSVPRIEEPDLISFLTTHCKSPFVVSNGVSHWPALNDHPWSSVEYLNSVAGKGRLVPVEIGKDYRVDSWSQQMMDWDELLKRTEDARPPLVYLAQHSLLSQFPALRDDVQIPDLVYSSPTSEFPKYTPPTNEDGFIINAWLGPKGTTSPAHQDPYFNCYAQVVGRKTVWLAHSQFVEEMYPLSSASGLSNTTSLDVFSSALDQPPLFVSNVIPESMAITLNPGDLLFFPPGWWHAMRSEDKSFSVSFWF